MPVGCTDPLLYAAGGNPNGVSLTDPGKEPPPEAKLAAARYQGQRVARFADELARYAQALVVRDMQKAA